MVIGDDWLTVKDEAGERRLDNSEDWVRREVSRALKQGIHVIPVLVENTAMPSVTRLPDDLKPLAKRNAARVRDDPDFDTDMERLCAAISKRLSGSRSSRPTPLAKPLLILSAAVTICALGLLTAYQFRVPGGHRNDATTSTNPPVADQPSTGENASILGKWEQKFFEREDWHSGGVYEFHTDSLGQLQLRAVSPPGEIVQLATRHLNVAMDGSKFKTEGKVLTWNADWGPYGVGSFRLERKNANLYVGSAFEEDGTEYRKNEFHRVID